MCLTYESIYEFAETREITVTRIPVAKEYERVHFIGHALYKPGITKEALMPYAGQIQDRVMEETGYKVWLRDVAVKHYPPFLTDVDFIFDVPVVSTSSIGRKKFSPIDPVTALIIIIALVVALYFIVFMFWTLYTEKYKIYYCDQESPPAEFTGWDAYLAHLAEKHPKKYDAIVKAKATDWWVAIPEALKYIAVAAVAVTAVGLIASAIPKRK